MGPLLKGASTLGTRKSSLQGSQAPETKGNSGAGKTHPQRSRVCVIQKAELGKLLECCKFLHLPIPF